MRIDSIHLKNYRCFADLPVELHPQMTVLVAPNGEGKTTVLDAIKVALWPFEGLAEFTNPGELPARRGQK